MLKHASLALVLSLAAFACERDYVYRPAVTTSSATIAGLPASYYGIPQEAPHGNVRIAMMGFADIKPMNASQPEAHTLQVRMIVANNSQRPWSLDTQAQLAALPNGNPVAPAYVTVNGATPPAITIAPGRDVTLDLFYPLPERTRKESQVPSFDFVWTVDTDARRVVERTPFERTEIVVAEESYPGSYVMGEPFYDTYYTYGGAVVMGPGPTFERRPVSVRRHTVRVIPGPR
jgi:hypothetical protein